MKILKLCSLFLMAFFTLGMGVSNTNAASSLNAKKQKSINKIVAGDALNRNLSPVSEMKQDKYVGMFYFAWHGQFGNQSKVYDVTKLLRDSPDDLWSIDSNNTVAPISNNYYFNEPLYGYYNSADPYIIRKHIEMFIAAGVDFIAYDFTNRKIFWNPLNTMLELLNEYHEAGWDVPQVTFFTKRDCNILIPELYEKVYSKQEYSHLWFRGSGEKPYIIAVKEEIPENIRDFFNIRYPQWPEEDFREDGFPYVEKVRPQRTYTNLISVSVAQHTGGAFSWSLKGPNGKQKMSWGRGYTTENPQNGNIEAIERGDNFQDEWTYAISQDPEIVFVTGWNEWIAGKWVNLENPAYGEVPYWVDSFNTEFSRDIEMTKSKKYVKDESGKYIEEGYGDNFYIQLIENVRKYKGVPVTKENYEKPVSKTIDVSGQISMWDDVNSTYFNISTDKVERNFRGFTGRETYTQAKPANFIQEIKVTDDKDNIYFYLKTKDNISSPQPNKTNWMNIFIGIEGNDKVGFEGYQYVINRYPNQDKTSLEVSEEGYHFTKVSDIDYSVQGNVMQIKVPKKDININSNEFSIRFKAADSIEKEDDIIDYYVSGDSVPMGRLSFSYSNAFIDNTKDSEKADADNKSYGSILNVLLLTFSIVAALICVILLAEPKLKIKLLKGGIHYEK